MSGTNRLGTFFNNLSDSFKDSFKDARQNRKTVVQTPVEDFKFDARGIGDFAGRVAADVVGDESRNYVWRFNHPLGTASYFGAEAARGNGTPYGYEALGGAALALGVLPVLSGNVDLTNLAQGGRVKGYEALFPNPINPTETTNLLGELAGRYFVGRRGDLLDYSELVKERPEITPDQYAIYKQSNGFMKKGFFGLEDNATTSLVGGLGLGAALGAYGKRPLRVGTGYEPRVVTKMEPRVANKERIWLEMPTGIEMGTRKDLAIGATKGGIIGGLVGAAVPSLAELGVIKDGKTLDGQDAISLLGYQTPLSAIGLTGLAALGIKKGVDTYYKPGFDIEKKYKEEYIKKRLDKLGVVRENGEFRYRP
jgi:hypothetical protein